MKKNRLNKIRLIPIILWLFIVALLSLMGFVAPGIFLGETIGQWVWFDKTALCGAVCVLPIFFFRPWDYCVTMDFVLSWALVAWGGMEAIWGLLQLYGYAASRHSLYAMTGSFYNPGPYSGYLAMTLPICLHRWLTDEGVKKRVSGATALLILCVLPAGMSRSAWVAATVSCLWVYGCHAGWAEKFQAVWRRRKGEVVTAVVGGVCALALAGYLLFTLKPDSARGRLLMWKMSCLAIAEQPWSGHGVGSFAAAYGDAQEAYFAAGDFEPWEERVAGSPEYAFNEYLQAAVELGIPLALCLTGVVIGCLCAGVRKRRYGICGALLSLMVFSFSSYPLQIPTFVVTLAGLLPACVLGDSRREWMAVALLAGCIGGFRLKSDVRTEQACREWTNARVLYHAGAYHAAEKEYERLYPLLKDRAPFLFEYGHGLHKQRKFEASNRILKEALEHSNDPMLLNIIGKNCQAMGDYQTAETWLIRSTHRLPGRIYPYYLLAKLYAEPDFYQPDKLAEMKRMVLTKEPKVNSTAVRQMKNEVKKMK